MKMKSLSALFVLLLLFTHHGFAQETLLDSNERKVFTAAGISSFALFTGAFLTDNQTRQFVQNHRSNVLTDYTDVMNYMGSKKLILSLNAVSYGTSLLLKDKRLETTSVNAFKSLVSSAILTAGLKQITGRARPHTDHDAYFFKPLPIFYNGGNDFKALPSGHATVAFAFFTPFAEEYSHWLYLIPASVAFSRVYKDKHWTSDVILGASFGFLSGYFFQHKDYPIEIGFNKLVIKF